MIRSKYNLKAQLLTFSALHIKKKNVVRMDPPHIIRRHMCLDVKLLVL